MSLGLWIPAGICVLVFFFFFFVQDFGIPYFSKGEKKWIDAITDAEEARFSVKRWWELMPRHAHLAIAVMWLFYLGNDYLHLAGVKFAANRVQYHTLLDHDEEYAILRMYGDTFYASLYDQDSKKLLGKFTAFEAVGHEWEMANVGPLERYEIEKEVEQE